MANQHVNKVQLSDGTVLVDLTSDTVASDKLHRGYRAHGRDGSVIIGTYDEPSAMTQAAITEAVESGWGG